MRHATVVQSRYGIKRALKHTKGVRLLLNGPASGESYSGIVLRNGH